MAKSNFTLLPKSATKKELTFAVKYRYLYTFTRELHTSETRAAPAKIDRLCKDSEVGREPHV